MRQMTGSAGKRAVVALARERLGRRLTTMEGDFLSARLPRCDAIVASFALHHVATRRRKARLYARCFRALRSGGLLVSADCSLASIARVRSLDRAAWRAHLERRYSARRANAYLRAWAKEDVYVRLDTEIALLRSAGFIVDVPWRQGSFAVIVGGKPGASGARRATGG